MLTRATDVRGVIVYGILLSGCERCVQRCFFATPESDENMYTEPRG